MQFIIVCAVLHNFITYIDDTMFKNKENISNDNLPIDHVHGNVEGTELPEEMT